MKNVSAKQLALLSEKKGWLLERVRGSHHVYVMPGSPVRISVPIHGNQDLKIGLLNHLTKLANIDESEL